MSWLQDQGITFAEDGPAAEAFIALALIVAAVLLVTLFALVAYITRGAVAVLPGVWYLLYRHFKKAGTK